MCGAADAAAGQRGNQDSNCEENLVCVSGFEDGGEHVARNVDSF